MFLKFRKCSNPKSGVVLISGDRRIGLIRRPWKFKKRYTKFKTGQKKVHLNRRLIRCSECHQTSKSVRDELQSDRQKRSDWSVPFEALDLKRPVWSIQSETSRVRAACHRRGIGVDRFVLLLHFKKNFSNFKLKGDKKLKYRIWTTVGY